MSEALAVVEPLPLEEQPWLMSSDHFPERPDIVQMVRCRSFIADKPPAKVFRHSGKILFKRLRADPETCEALCWAIKLGMSAREVARRFGMSPNSVVQIREAMDERGELEAIGRRIDRRLNQFVELGYEVIIEGAATGAIHPGQLPIPVLAADDKRRQRDAGMVVGTERTQAAVTMEQVMLAAALARRAIESGSDARAAKAKQIGPVLDLDTGLATGPQPVSTPHATAVEGGGGDRPSAAGQNDRGDAPENSNP
jgi:DNA-binding Lrp family transcriptional regulator